MRYNIYIYTYISLSRCINMSLEVQVDNFWKDVSIKTALFRKGVLSFQGIILSSLTYRSSRVEYITQLTGGLSSHLYWRSRKAANYRHPLPMSGSHKITMMKENHKFWMGVMGEDCPQSWKSTKKASKTVCTCLYSISIGKHADSQKKSNIPPQKKTHIFSR